MTARFILNADDYAIAAGVSRGIQQLAKAGRISSTSAIVTLPRWREDAKALRDLRPLVAIGLHLNLTLGAPLASMPRLAPSGQFPSSGALAVQSAAQLFRHEITGEIERQVDAFESAIGNRPDFVDGHHHAHALPGVRRALLEVLAQRDATRAIFLRDPSDDAIRLFQRNSAVIKAMGVTALTRGFGAAAQAAGFRTNDGFSGFFDCSEPVDRIAEHFSTAATRLGPLHLMMCHPGFADEELASLDGLTTRREQELKFLMHDDAFAAQVWRAQRGADGGIVWPTRFAREIST